MEKYDKGSMLGFTSVDERVSSQLMIVILAYNPNNSSEFPTFMETLYAGERTFLELHFPTGAR